MKLISVIVPVYRAEKYLRECVDSILSSTYSNLEIILVDDGSPDNCPHICDEYARMYPRIKVVHQENRGFCGARNAGILAAKGEYVAFVDSDDMVSPLLYEHLVSLIEEGNADWAACGFVRRYPDLPVQSTTDGAVYGILQGFEEQLSVLTCASSVRDKTWTSSYIWNKLYRKSKLMQLFSEDCYHSEDLLFNWHYMKNCSRMAYSSMNLYFYRLNEDSVTETYRKNKAEKATERGISVANVYWEIAENVPGDYPDLKKYLISRAAYVMHGALFRMNTFGVTGSYSEFCKKAGKYIRKHWKTVWDDKETYNIRVRFAIVLFVFFYPLWLVATKFLKT